MMNFDLFKKSPFDRPYGPEEEDDASNGANDFTQAFVPSPDPAQAKDDEIRQSYFTDQYRKEQKKLDNDLAEAAKMSKYAGLIDVIGSAATQYANAGRKPVQLVNRMRDLGKPAQLIEAQKADWKSIQPYADAEESRLRQAKKDSYGALKQGVELDAIDRAQSKEMRSTDVQSDLSKQSRLLYQTKLLAKAGEAEKAGDLTSAAAIKAMAKGATNLSADDIKSGLGDLKDLDWRDTLANQAADKRLEASERGQDRRIKDQWGREEAKEEKAKLKATQDGLKTLSSRYTSDPVTKNTLEMRQSVQAAESLAHDDTGKSDMALIYSFAKTLDPSVVKEGEYAMYSSNPSIQGQIDSWIERKKSGKLDAAAKKELMGAMRSKMKAQESMQADVDDLYTQQSAVYGVDPGLFIRKSNPNGRLIEGGAPAKPIPVGHGSQLPD